MSYSYSKSNGDTESSTDFTNTYIMRALHSIKSTMMVGEISTGSDVLILFHSKELKYQVMRQCFLIANEALL